MDQQIVQLGGHDIAYFDIGEGAPILLIHGFASTAQVNWINTNWVKVLNEAGYRCIAIDNRGHGSSSKYYDPSDYGPDIFSADALGLMDYLDIQNFPVLGYSMGARITAWLSAHHGDRVSCAIFGGMGINMIGPRGNFEPIAKALETDDPDNIPDPKAAMFRKFADRTGSDRLALAACIRPSREKITADLVSSINVPVLVAVGDLDETGGDPAQLADLIPDGHAVLLPGLDHMKATGAATFKQAALEFLSKNAPVG